MTDKPRCLLCHHELTFIRFLVGIWNHYICDNCNTQQRARIAK